VAIKKTSSLPSPVKDAITVNYQNYACSSESDITVIVFPDDPRFTDENIDLYTNRGNINKGALDELVGDTFTRFEVGIIQCKTNWNDNAQIPMLWDAVYSANTFRNGISVGSDGFSIHDTKRFTYSFVTVPSNQLVKNGRETYKNTSTAVLRVINLSGGNYWGLESRAGIASSVKELLERNLKTGHSRGLLYTIRTALPELNTTYRYFDLLL
jgi:hypothetical protein